MSKNAFVLVLWVVVIIRADIIRIGDVISITVLSNTEFSGSYEVENDGTIEYPLLAEEPVIDMTTSELMNVLTFRLARHLENPLVLVSIVDKPEINVTVLGQVEKPGPVRIYEGATVQEVLLLAGGTTQAADLERIRIINKTLPHRSENCNLKTFLRDGNLDSMPLLKGNDIIVVLALERSEKIKVIGAVQKPGMFDIEDNMNIFETIYMAGGPAEKADLSKVRIFSNQNGKTIENVIDIQKYITQGKMDNIPMVTEGDVIIVYTNWFDWRTILTIMNNALLFVITLQTFAGIFK